MRRSLVVCGVALVVGAAASLGLGASGAAAPGGRWVIRDLGTLGGPGSDAVAINERGQIVGWAHTGKKDQYGNFVSVAFLWKNGRMRPLTTKDVSGVTDINERGQVSGTIERKDGTTSAVLWENGRTRVLGHLSSSMLVGRTEAIALNDRGQVIVEQVDRGADGIIRGFLWESGKITDLGSLSVDDDGYSDTRVRAINNRGQIVGTSFQWRDKSDHVFLWQNGEMADLGRFFALSGYRPLQGATPVPPTGFLNDRGQIAGRAGRRAAIWDTGRIHLLATLPIGISGLALDLNELGAAAGYCEVRPLRVAHPCLWRDGSVADLGLVYGDRGTAVALNDREQVIGRSRLESGEFHAFVWENGTMTDLGTLPGGNESTALAINNRGQIVGSADTKTGKSHAVLWTWQSTT